MSLQFLPYDLLFNIAQDLDIDDVHNLQATCKSLRLFTLTRPVYRQLAHDLLARSRPLPLHSFQRLSDLSTPALIAAVDRARGFEKAWAIRAPRPARPNPYYGNQWYITISVPSHEEIDWLSPITSSYTLCATKSGRVLCWDVRRDICLAEWDPRSLTSSCGGDEDEDEDDEDKWELWKCRVEFEERTVYFTMARVLKGHHDDRVMEFMLMRLFFPHELDDYDEINQAQLYVQSPILSHLDHYASAAEPQSRQREGDSPIQLTPRVPSPTQDPPSLIPICDQPPTPTPSPPTSQTPSPQDSSLLHSGSFGPSSTTSSAQCSPMAINAMLPPDSAECSDPPQLNGIPSNQANTVGIRGDGGAGEPYQGPVFCHPSLRAMFIRSAPATPSWERYIPLPMNFDQPPPPPPVSTIPIPESARPVFDTLTSFHTTGVIMNVFLLDPPRRLLSAFVWIASSNTIGLYVLLDWAKDDYVFVDTGVGCLISSNWSCILHEDQIVIHSEEADAAYQHFYPLEVLRAYGCPRRTVSPATRAQTPPQAEDGVPQENNGEDIADSLKSLWNKLPKICARLPPSRSISKNFVFPSVPGTSGAVVGVLPVGDGDEDTEEEDEAGAAEEDQGQTEDNTEPVSEEGQTGVTEVSSTVPSAEDEQSVGHEEPVDEEEPPNDEEESEDTHEGEEEIPSNPKRKGERRTRFEDEEAGNDSRADGPSDSQGGGDELNAGSSSSSQVGPGPEPVPQDDEDASSSQSTTSTTSGPQQPTQDVVGPATPESFTNPYPFPPWYPESAHFVRQWWPTLPGVPRLSCTVVLLAAHDHETHHTRFVLAQHYFKVPIAPEGLPVAGESSTSSSSHSAQANDDDMLHLWYVSTPFEVVCVLEEGDDDEDTSDRPRPLVAVDFGHAVWVEYGASVVPPTLNVRARADSNSPGIYDADIVQPNTEPDTQLHAHFAHFENDHSHPHPRRRVPKCLRFVTFPPVHGRRVRTEEAVVRTLEIPEELDLDVVETINIDQSQGAVILSVRDGKIFILRYE
ncbi:uncharacterized protein BJ212DRAFT_1320462 [Suillus subaureus]|uniref:F-box domain-containing protein n=1 Tax=Suillus subaureus TaxID=48587 RepID=A0A9P7EKS6_9AGAM|nr:uncharacterized protein BJ212DRAFT_1320462 [Suillus subaureus]KAG1824479.1 hypothetical protein BJ212DRAFT_1320462 [Suillus subaureus]